MACENPPPPLMANATLNFHFDFLTPSLRIAAQLTLFTPAYFGISGTRGGHIVPPLSILGLGGVRVPILFGNDLPMND